MSLIVVEKFNYPRARRMFLTSSVVMISMVM